MRKKIYLIISSLLLSTQAFALDLASLSRPDSVVVDPRTGDTYISNTGDPADEKSSGGFITKVSTDGLIVVLRFIESKPGVYELRAPKGLAIDRDALCVVDTDSVKVFKLESGSFIRSVELPTGSAKALKDIVAAPDGTLYFTDTEANRIYRIDPANDYKLHLYKKGEDLGQPKGIIYNRLTRNLVVAASQTGDLLEIDRKGKVRKIKKGLDSPESLAVDRDGNIYVSNSAKGEIYRITRWGRGSLSLFQGGLNGPADIFYDTVHQVLQVPLAGGNALTSYPVREELRNKQPRKEEARTAVSPQGNFRKKKRPRS